MRISELPPHMRKQVEDKIGTPKKSKYGNVKTQVDGTTFMSKHEAEIYSELQLLEKAGEITALSLQVPFTLAGGVKYIADFVYYDKRNQEWTVADAKGFKTDTYKIKKKLMAEIGVEISER